MDFVATVFFGLQEFGLKMLIKSRFNRDLSQNLSLSQFNRLSLNITDLAIVFPQSISSLRLAVVSMSVPAIKTSSREESSRQASIKDGSGFMLGAFS